MSCYLEENNGEVKAVLEFSREQLLYDIRNYCYIAGHIMTESHNEVRHTIQDVGEEGNVDRVTRVLNLSVSRCKELLYPYTKHKIRHKVLRDKLREVPVYGIVLSLPGEYSQTSLNLLEQLIHEYLVCTCVADWLSICAPEKKQEWEDKAEAALQEVRVSLNARMGRTRRRLHPF